MVRFIDQTQCTMPKSRYFTGQPVLRQVLKAIPRALVNQVAHAHQSDRYVKRFSTYDHLVTMLYATLGGFSSLRTLEIHMTASLHRLSHLGLSDRPRRSTISDSNRKRSSAVFGDLYHRLWQRLAPDLRPNAYFQGLNPSIAKMLTVLDATTISLFSNIFEGAGRMPIEGSRKGGVKVHTAMNADTGVPSLLRITDAKVHDRHFWACLQLEPGSYVTMDRGFQDYVQFAQLHARGICIITRLKSNNVYQVIEEHPISKEEAQQGICAHQTVILKKPKDLDDQLEWPTMRRIVVQDPGKKPIALLTNCPNDDTHDVLQMANIYRHRWQIETMFKRLKQHFPLTYFLGQSRNAIEIQIWCTFIGLLLMEWIRAVGGHSHRAFSHMVSLVRGCLMEYLDLHAFLKDPEKEAARYAKEMATQVSLFSDDTG
jgi:hypothetical protein